MCLDDADSVAAGTDDYHLLGYDVVWILHDQRYNQRRLTALEASMTHTPHYYSNMNAKGKGFIYDQWQWVEKGLRKERLKALPIEITKVYRSRSSPYLMRPDTWSVKCIGDLGLLDVNDPYRLCALKGKTVCAQTSAYKAYI